MVLFIPFKVVNILDPLPIKVQDVIISVKDGTNFEDRRKEIQNRIGVVVFENHFKVFDKDTFKNFFIVIYNYVKTIIFGDNALIHVGKDIVDITLNRVKNI